MPLKLFHLFIYFLLFTCCKTYSQISFSDSLFRLGVPNSVKLSSSVFVDYYYKAHGDSLVRGIGVNQYSGIPPDRNAFAFRRIFLGFDYNISKKFVAELLLASEDHLNVTTFNGNVSNTGDLLTNNKFAFYVKRANLRWKNIFKGTDLAFGEVTTPSFFLLTQQIWAYRSLEKTIADIRKTPSTDLGVTIQSHLGSKDNFGFNIMVANGTSSRPENDAHKWIYGDFYAKFFNKKLVIDVYGDYTKIDWTKTFHHSRNMLKGMIAYNTPQLTLGAEAFINHGKNDVVGLSANKKDTLNSNATCVSVYVHGNIINERLRYVLRYDFYNPNTKYDKNKYESYKGFSSAYEPSNNEHLLIAGIDYAITKDIHILPNIWYTKYNNKQYTPTSSDHDLVYRLTLSYAFGK